MFSPEESKRVAELVRAVEARTSGEVAVAWAARSDDYALVRGLWALALASAVSVELAVGLPAIPLLLLPMLTVLGTIGLYFLLGAGPILRAILPDALLSERVQRRAQIAFLECGVTETAARGGVLLFLSAVEHRVQILADTGIAARVDAKVWQAVVDELILALKDGRTMPGLERALGRIGDLLETEFPRAPGDQNELGDAPRELGPA